MRITRNGFYLPVILLIWALISCNKVEVAPLPTLAPVAQIPEITPTAPGAKATETPPPPIETPDGSRTFIDKGSIIYFNAVGAGPFLVGADRAEPVRLYDLQNISRFLAAAPNGEWFVLMNGGQLYSAKADGSANNRLSDVENISWITWSPNGERFAFIQEGNIFTINADGRGLRRLTNELALNDTSNSLSWSPNGDYLLFTCTSAASDICLVNSQGDEAVVNLTNNTEPALYREQQWSPDGDLISFVALDQADNLQIFTMEADGTELVQLTDTGENSLHTWSPDGTRIVYANIVDDKWQAMVMDRDGAAKLPISENMAPEINSILPSWSPDGNLISLFFTLPSNLDEFSISVWGIDNSQQPIKLTDRARWAEWSPDGTQIAFLSPEFQIKIVNFDGLGTVNLIDCPEGCEFFTWLP